MTLRGFVLCVVLLVAGPARADDVPTSSGSAVPSGPNVSAEIQAVRAVMDERDRRYEDRFKAQEKAVDAALVSAEKAVAKAEAAAEKRFDSVNEFRAQQKDLISTYVPRQEFEAHTKALADLKAEMARMIPREEFDGQVATTAALATRLERMDGERSGVSTSWGLVVTVVTVILAVVAVVISRKQVTSARSR